MTDITNQDRRLAREWAASINPEMDFLSASTRAVARVILANVDAPEPTLSEELANITEHWEEWATDMITVALAAATDRAKQTEYDLAEARAEVEHLTDVNENLRRTGNYQEFREQFLTVQKGAESNAESLGPADVKPGEAWLIKVDGRTAVGVRDGVGPTPEWSIIDIDYGGGSRDFDYTVTLVSRLVPAPRVITNADDLDRAKRDTVIRDARGVVCSRDSAGTAWTTFTNLTDQRRHIVLPATVLWEPEA